MEHHTDTANIMQPARRSKRMHLANYPTHHLGCSQSKADGDAHHRWSKRNKCTNTARRMQPTPILPTSCSTIWSLPEPQLSSSLPTYHHTRRMQAHLETSCSLPLLFLYYRGLMQRHHQKNTHHIWSLPDVQSGCTLPTIHHARRMQPETPPDYCSTIWDAEGCSTPILPTSCSTTNTPSGMQRDAGKNNPLGCFGLICIDLYCFIPDGCREPTQHLEPQHLTDMHPHCLYHRPTLLEVRPHLLGLI